ncbi:MAG: transcriptional repressor [Opitutae bacterium]|nr:transcriptional repressor [Opitutae bacterium]
MNFKLKASDKEKLDKALAKKGLRTTKQRSFVYSVILGKRDHPTADEILLRVRNSLPSISLATVYNCLESLVECALVRQVNMDRSPSRFCPNLSPHAHFKCTKSGKIVDLSLKESQIKLLKKILPKGFVSSNFDLTFNGTLR